MEENKDINLEGQNEVEESGVRLQSGDGFRVIPLKGLIDNWFIDYASSVILDRAVPEINDGFKPVQRRILHSMKELEDGRYNKVANIVGNTMKYPLCTRKALLKPARFHLRRACPHFLRYSGQEPDFGLSSQGMT